MSLLTLSDESARSLGLSLTPVRVGSLLVAVRLTAIVAAAVGVIGFVGLAAPHIARLAGARRLGERLILSAVSGAGLLLTVD